MIPYHLIGLHYYHLWLVVDVWGGEHCGFSGRMWERLACPTP